jgi:hypothetical protein
MSPTGRTTGFRCGVTEHGKEAFGHYKTDVSIQQRVPKNVRTQDA